MVNCLLHPVPSIPIQPVTRDELDDKVLELSKAQQNWVRELGFRAAIGQTLCLPDAEGTVDRVLFGLGDDDARRRERLVFGDLVAKIPPGNYHLQPHPELDDDQAALAWLLSSYRFDSFIEKNSEIPKLVTPANVDKARVEIIAQSCQNAMDLINRPANHLNIGGLIDQVDLIARRYSGRFEVLRGDALLSAGFPLVHAVGRAGSEAPALATLEWGEAKNPLIAIIGKGVVFDTGGLNIKPGSSMSLMKKDMGGAANAIALAEMIMALDLPIRLLLVVPMAENSIAGNAIRPGDILRSRAGLSIEINNTDAEGRLILADAIAFANEKNPEHIITLATLTGAARVALGPDLVPMYSEVTAFVEAMKVQSQRVEDPVWHMPFWAPYETMLNTPNADLDNSPSGGFAGSITAALFLRRFAKSTPFSHFDIYGWTPKALPGRPFGGAAQAIRAIFASFEAHYGR